MAPLPGLDEDWLRTLGWTQSQLIIYILTDYFVIAIYTLLSILALRNVLMIILRQREYKNLPILVFYAFALIAINLRLVFLLFYWQPNNIIWNLDWIQQGAKLCVGVVQDWITLELAVRIHSSKSVTEISEVTERKLRKTRRILFAAITVTFIAFSIAVIVSAHKPGNAGLAFAFCHCSLVKIIGYVFLL